MITSRFVGNRLAVSTRCRLRGWAACLALLALVGCETTSKAPPSVMREAFPGIRVDAASRIVELDAKTCLKEGWLEQVACSPRSREHESLMVVGARPMHIHQALLMAGFTNGAPGYWTYEDDTYREVAPRGDAVSVHVRYVGADGVETTVPVARWIRDHNGKREFPGSTWIFGGSRFEPNPPDGEPGEYYVADYTGSLIGIVTFGDEVLGFADVIADQTDVTPAEWEANPDTMPEPDTEVVIVIRPAD